MRRTPRIAPFAASLSMALFAAGSSVAAGDCLSACSNTYDAAMASCQRQYADADEEVQLQECLDAAMAAYGTCTDACETAD